MILYILFALSHDVMIFEFYPNVFEARTHHATKLEEDAQNNKCLAMVLRMQKAYS